MTNSDKSVREEGSLWGIDMGGTKIEGVILKSVGDPKYFFVTEFQPKPTRDMNTCLIRSKK